jgi:hypothetical protein
VLDGIGREQAIAEMRQWCGTAAKYPGLYDAIALGEIPSAEETAAFEWRFESGHTFKGLRESMIPLARSWDQIKFAQKRGWKNDPEHPDIDMVHEASKIAQLLDHVAKMDEVAGKPADFRKWMKDAVPAAKGLESALASVRDGEDGAPDVANARFVALGNLCASCHGPYRNAE